MLDSGAVTGAVLDGALAALVTTDDLRVSKLNYYCTDLLALLCFLLSLEALGFG